MNKELGKISRASFGYGGYQDAMIGLTINFEGNGWGCAHHEGFWSSKHSESCKWSESDRLEKLGQVVMNLSVFLQRAKVKDVSNLVGIPVECTFDNFNLTSWRILEEVL